LPKADRTLIRAYATGQADQQQCCRNNDQSRSHSLNSKFRPWRGRARLMHLLIIKHDPATLLQRVSLPKMNIASGE
jgi:hypothetical protein